MQLAVLQKKRKLCTVEPLAMQGLEIQTPELKHVETIDYQVHVIWNSYRKTSTILFVVSIDYSCYVYLAKGGNWRV